MRSIPALNANSSWVIPALVRNCLTFTARVFWDDLRVFDTPQLSRLRDCQSTEYILHLSITRVFEYEKTSHFLFSSAVDSVRIP